MGKPGRKPMDIAGQRFGKLTAEKYVPNTKKGSYWLCSCDCGNSVVVSLGNLKKGNTKSCGCLSKKGKPYGERPREKRNELSSTSEGRRRRADELCGKQFGRLTVLSFQGVNKNHHSVYLCRCSCGKTVSVVRNALTTGNTGSCGCLNAQKAHETSFKHGDASKNSPYGDILPRLMRGGGFLLKNPNGFSIDRLSPHALWFARCFTSRVARRFFWLRPGCSGRRSRPGRAGHRTAGTSIP